MLTQKKFNLPEVPNEDKGLRGYVERLKKSVLDILNDLNIPGSLNITQTKIQNCTIEDTPIGATTPAAGTFTALTSTGNTILGDASTDTLNVGNGGIIKDASGNVGIGVTPSYKLDVLGSGTVIARLANGSRSITIGGDGIEGYLQVASGPFAIYSGVSFMQFSTTGLGIGVTPTTKFHVAGATSGAVHVNDTGQLYGTALHNNAGAVTGTTNQYVASGTYTPTLTGITNVDGTSAFVCQWTRVGNVVTVSGSLNIDPTSANTFTRVGISLPIASNFSGTNQAGGTGSSYNGTTNDSAYIYSDFTNDRAELNCTPGSAGDASWWFAFQYEVL